MWMINQQNYPIWRTQTKMTKERFRNYLENTSILTYVIWGHRKRQLGKMTRLFEENTAQIAPNLFQKFIDSKQLDKLQEGKHKRKVLDTFKLLRVKSR